MWWHTPVLPVFGRMRQEDHEERPGLLSEKSSVWGFKGTQVNFPFGPEVY